MKKGNVLKIELSAEVLTDLFERYRWLELACKRGLGDKSYKECLLQKLYGFQEAMAIIDPRLEQLRQNLVLKLDHLAEPDKKVLQNFLDQWFQLSQSNGLRKKRYLPRGPNGQFIKHQRVVIEMQEVQHA